MTDDTNLPSPTLQTLLEKSRVEMVRMILKNSDGKLPLTASKVGGMGYLPMGETYPSQADGKPLALLVQINFSELSNAVDLTQLPQPLPDNGILQIYIGNTDLYGADFDNPYPSDTYQVRYWVDTNLPVNQADLDETMASVKTIFLEEDYVLPFGVNDEFALTFEQAVQSCNLYAYDPYEVTGKTPSETSELYDEDAIEAELKAKGLDDVDPYDVIDKYLELAGVGGHQILGYPYFTQTDPREYEKSLRQHILLFQLDSDDDVDIMWGDMGVANFFITPEALLARDFNQLVYNWDCS